MTNLLTTTKYSIASISWCAFTVIVADLVSTDGIAMADVWDLYTLVDILAAILRVTTVTTIACTLVGTNDIGAEALPWTR